MRNKEIKRMNRPKFIVFTDKDGTLNLEDKQLKRIMKYITSIGGMTILTTGRTVGDVKEDFKRRKLTLPKIIIGDNGANIYATDKDTFLIKRRLEQEKCAKIIEYFLQNGGNPDLIRYTDGSHIFASTAKDVEAYYQGNKTAQLFERVQDEILKTEGLTKITLAGSKKQMEQVAEYVATLGFWTDMDATKFPQRDAQNYRLDIAQKGINKGEAVKRNSKLAKTRIRLYVCWKWLQ